MKVTPYQMAAAERDARRHGGGGNVANPEVYTCETQLIPFPCHVIQTPPVLFHDNSAFPLWDPRGNLPASIIGSWNYLHQHPDNNLVLIGFACQGNPSKPLAEARANALLAYLQHDPDAWLAAVQSDYRCIDCQVSLNSLAEKQGWFTHCGETDDIDGPDTQQGVRGFQTEYNSRHRGELEPDGIVGPHTLKAFFTATHSLLEKHWMEWKSGAPFPTIQHGDAISGAFPQVVPTLGETKVEFQFFEPGNEPEIIAYEPNLIAKTPIVVDGALIGDNASPKGGATVHLVNTESALLSAIEVQLLADGEMIFAGQLPDGVLELVDMVHCQLVLAVKAEGKLVKRTIHWKCGEPPYAPQLVQVPFNPVEEGAA